MADNPEEQASKKIFVRSKSMRHLTQPKEIKSCLLRVLASEYIRKKCKVTVLPSEQWIDDLVNKIVERLGARAKTQLEASRLLQKDMDSIMSSAYQDQLNLLATVIREMLSDEFHIELEELNERLINSLVGVTNTSLMEENRGAAAKRVLIVDDTPQTRTVLSHILIRSGFQIGEATDGLDAINKMATFKPDLLLLDVKMPKMTGIEVLEQLKSDPATRDIPIIMISAHSDSGIIQQAIKIGARDFIVKPFQSSIVVGKIQRILCNH